MLTWAMVGLYAVALHSFHLPLSFVAGATITVAYAILRTKARNTDMILAFMLACSIWFVILPLMVINDVSTIFQGLPRRSPSVSRIPRRNASN